MNLTAGESGKYIVETATLQVPVRAPLAELTLTAGQSETIDLITSTFAEQGQLLITCEATGVVKKFLAAERKMLYVKAKSVKCNGAQLTSQSLKVYKTEKEALSDASTTATLTASGLTQGANIEMLGIESEDDLLYFSYVNENKVYIASATVRDLYNSEAVLDFAEREIVVNIEVFSLLGSEYYGKDRDVILIFNADVAGTYKITHKENNTTYTTNIDCSAGRQKVTLKTKTWSDQLVDITISRTVGSTTYYSDKLTGGSRNIIGFGKLKFQRSRTELANDINVTIKYNSTTITTVTYAKLKSKTYVLELDGVREDSKLNFSYKENNNGTSRNKDVSISNVINGTTVDF